MDSFTLKAVTDAGVVLEATFLPKQGMALASYTIGDFELIDQTTRQGFEERRSGLGPLIGPHFHRRRPEVIPNVKELEKLPHIQFCRDHQLPDPFSHGVARYAPWRVETTKSSFTALLSGEDEWEGISLKSIENQAFEMRFSGLMTSKGLDLKLSVTSETDSVVGIHYYYALPSGKGAVRAQVSNHYIFEGKTLKIPEAWSYDAQNYLELPLNQDVDFTFHPYPNPLKGEVVLETEAYRLKTVYTSDSEESAFQLWHPKGASFVCVEPVSAYDPRHPNLTVSALNISLYPELKV